MSISKEILEMEKGYLKRVLKVVTNDLDVLGKEIKIKEEKITEFRRVLWEEKGSIDSVEMQTSLTSSVFEANFMIMKMDRYKALIKLSKNPYFGRIDFKTGDKLICVYVGIANLNDNQDYLIYDWRSPIASLFYDYGVGPCMYEAPDGLIKGVMTLKRQYKIENQKLIRVFDNNLNVNDEVLQDVLSSSSSEKMKNIVNTIQKEQNEVIRNTNNKHLIVQGIAGSGKTSVALHRIAFLLYKIKNLSSSNVLIFSPNNVFTEYISNVLPELGENNTMNTTFSEFLNSYIKEFKLVESFTDFIERYYTKKESNPNLVAFKLSKQMIYVIEKYCKELEENVCIVDDLDTKYEKIEKTYLNYLLKDRYSKLPLFSRLEKMAEHLCDKTGVSYGKKRSFIKNLKDLINIKPDFKKIYENLFTSNSFKEFYKKEDIVKLNTKLINYDDALCFTYLKGILNGFPYSNLIKQIVIDEAQDYNQMQYIILRKIFKNASFTILGDVNQTINPYQKYDCLETLKNILNENCKYIELTKTYRSSNEIIQYTNKILNLKYVSAIRKPNNVPVKFRDNINDLVSDILTLKDKYNSVAIITKSKDEAILLNNFLEDKVSDISLIENTKKDFNRNLVIIPCYLAKGLEFDSVISYTNKDNVYNKSEKYLFYVALTRAQHELIIYNNPSW